MADAAVGHVGRVGDVFDVATATDPDTAVILVGRIPEVQILGAVAYQAWLGAVLRLEVAAVDADAFRTVTVGAGLCGHRDGPIKRRRWVVLIEIDTSLSVIASRNPEHVAIVARHQGSVGDSDGVVSATVVGQRQAVRDGGPGRPVGPIAALHVVVIHRRDTVGCQVEGDVQISAVHREGDVADRFDRIQRVGCWRRGK